MRRILDDDDDADENVVSLPVASETDKVASEEVAGVSPPQDSASESAGSESDNESDDRPRCHADPEGGCLGKGFNPYIMPVDTLVKKLERRKADWQKKQLDIDAAIDRAMYPTGSLMDHDDVIIEEDDDQPGEDVSCDDAGGSHMESPVPAVLSDVANSHTERGTPLQLPSQAVHEPQHDGDAPAAADGSDQLADLQQTACELVMNTASTTARKLHPDNAALGQEASGVDASVQMPACIEAPPAAQLATAAKVFEACTMKADMHSLEPDLRFRDDRQPDSDNVSRLSDENGVQVQEHPEHSTDNDSMQVQDAGGDHRTGMLECAPLDSLDQLGEEDESQLGSGLSPEDNELAEGPSEDDLQGLEDSDAEPMDDHDADEDDEEAMLEAAIMQERRAQQLLAAKKSRANNQFCDGEAEQSEDEAVSSDESDDDGNGAMSAAEIADMMRELRETGLGEKEVADAHAKWLEDEDERALKNLLHGIKKGFGKGRKRVLEDAEDWDVDEARERRRALLPQAENPPSIRQTKDEVILQYKRKLAALERSLEHSVKPAAKPLHSREQAPALLAGAEKVVLPEIDDTDDSPRSQRARPWAPLFRSQAGEAPSMSLSRPESQSWDAGNILGPSLMGKSRNGSGSMGIKSTSRSVMACTLGASSSRAGASSAAGNAVPGISASARACHTSDQATFTKIREALGM